MQRSIGKPFERLGGAMIDPEMVLPAALPLDLCGESVRARLCLFKDHLNRDLALRPDLTLAVAVVEVEARKSVDRQGQTVRRYNARAFRQPAIAGEPLEFTQVGFERFGAERSADVDAESFALVSEAAREAGVRAGVTRFGDLSLLPHFITAFALPTETEAGLKRAFREDGGVRAYIARASRPVSGFVRSLIGLSLQDVEAQVEAHMAERQIIHFADRSKAEIVSRLVDQARHADEGAVPLRVQETLAAVLDLRCPPEAATDALHALALGAGVQDALSPHLETLARRFDQIAADAPVFLKEAEFGPGFGRRFTYYDGFVFEIAEPGERQARPFGAGGRYDHLLSDLSKGSVSATAIGGVVRPDRLALARDTEQNR